MPIEYLSYYIDERTPMYGGGQGISITSNTKIDNGDSSNSVLLQFPNHMGTHIDFPKHFSNQGKTINNYNPDFWIFRFVFVVEYEAGAEEIIDSKIFKNIDVPGNTEFLIIKTGFQQYRNTKKYWNNNPGVSPELATYIKQKCTNIKTIGFDFISISSYQNRMLGREAHKEFLVNNDILIIEDMKLDVVSKNINKVIALPLMINNIDGAPITVIAEYE